MKILAALVRQRNTCTLCWPFEACESVGSNTQDRAEHLTVANWPPPLRSRWPTIIRLILLAVWKSRPLSYGRRNTCFGVLKEPFEKLGRSPSAERTQAEAHEGPYTQDRAEHLTAETGHHLEVVIATCHLTWRCCTGGRQFIQHPVFILTALGEIRCVKSLARPQQYAHDSCRC